MINIKCKKCPDPNSICWCVLHPGNKSGNVSEQIKRIKKGVAGQYGITVKALESKSRAKEMVRARNTAILKCWHETDATLSAIAAAFNRKHSTISHVLKQFKPECRDKRMREED